MEKLLPIYFCLTTGIVYAIFIFSAAILQKEIKIDENQLESERLNWWTIGFIILAFLVLIFSFFSPVLFTRGSEISELDFSKTGQIGDTIGGIMNPFIAIVGVIVTGLAFYMQYRANKIQVNLFNQTQKEQNNLIKEQHFFRLVDNLSQRIINFSYSENTVNRNSDYFSYKSLDNLTKKFLYKIDYKCIALGRQLLAKQPEKIDIVHYIKLLQAITLNELATLESAKELQKSIIERKKFNERWEYIKLHVGSKDNANENENRALKSIGHVYFYKIDFKEREDLYINVYDEIYRDFGGFMDGYTKNITYIMDFVMKNKENLFFIDYLKSNLSTQELILIFYFCASRKSNEKIRSQIKETNLLESIALTRDKFIDVPTESELNKETEFILNRIDTLPLPQSLLKRTL